MQRERGREGGREGVYTLQYESNKCSLLNKVTNNEYSSIEIRKDIEHRLVPVLTELTHSSLILSSYLPGQGFDNMAPKW